MHYTSVDYASAILFAARTIDLYDDLCPASFSGGHGLASSHFARVLAFFADVLLFIILLFATHLEPPKYLSYTIGFFDGKVNGGRLALDGWPYETNDDAGSFGCFRHEEKGKELLRQEEVKVPIGVNLVILSCNFGLT